MWSALLRACLFTDAAPIVRAGRKRALLASDAPELAYELRPETASRTFDRLSFAPFWPFILRLFFSTGGPASGILALTLARVGAGLATPFLLHAVLERLSSARDLRVFPWPLLGFSISL